MPTATQQLPEAAVGFYELGQRFTAAGLVTMRSIWRGMSFADIDGSWSVAGRQALSALAALQVASAREAGLYVADVLDEQGMRAPAVARVEPLAFARGSSGLPLSDVLATVPARVKQAIGAGNPDEALGRGLRLLEGITQTHIADAARLATTANSIVRPAVQWYTRVLNPPSCGRCAILAGRQYRTEEAFKRHDGCDCRSLPATVAANDGRLFDARVYFDGLSAADQDEFFGKHVAQQIRDGGDLTKAVNSSRDAYRVRLAGERAAANRAAVPLAEQRTPQTFLESLIHEVNDRQQAIRNLQSAGYVAA